MSERALSLTPSTNDQQGGGGCGCATDMAAGKKQTAGTAGAVAGSGTFQVTGMTCGHCVAAVTQEVSAGVPGVLDVQVDLASGRVTVFSDRPLQKDAVRIAVEKAGYQLVPGSVR